MRLRAVVEDRLPSRLVDLVVLSTYDGEEAEFTSIQALHKPTAEEIAYRINHFDPAPLSGEGDKP